MKNNICNQTILIRGAYGETNFGDDLLMLVFEEFFNKNFESSRIVFSGRRLDYPAILLNKAGYNQKIVPNIVVYGGGTQFFSFVDQKNMGIVSKLKRLLLNPRIFIKYFANLLVPKTDDLINIPIVFLGFGLGPFKNVDAEIRAKERLRKAVFIGVRDNVSAGLCDRWGLDYSLGADVVFSSWFRLPKLSAPTNTKRRIGVIVRDWEWEETGASYIEKLRSYIDNNNDEVEFRYIIFAPKLDAEWMQYLSDKSCLVWNPLKEGVTSFLNSLNSFDGFISARYHGAIVASLLNKPVICVEIEPKLAILCSQVPEMKIWSKPFKHSEIETHIRSLDFNIDYTASLVKMKRSADMMLNAFKQSFINDDH